MKRFIFFSLIVLILVSNYAFAKIFVLDGANVKCLDDNGKYAINTFRWYDDNNDGISELYYFDDLGNKVVNDFGASDYELNAEGKHYCTYINNKLLQMPNQYVNDTYYLMMTNALDLSEADRAYKSYYDSVEAFVNKYTNDKLAEISYLGIGQRVQEIKEEAMYELPAYTYRLMFGELNSFYHNNEIMKKYDNKLYDLYKKQLDKILSAVRKNNKDAEE